MTIAPNWAVTDVTESPNHWDARSGDPDQIVIHHWGRDGQTHQGVVNWLCRANGNSSAHYVASAGRVTQIAADWQPAWHAGTAEGNHRGIGIECRPECSPGDFETVATLVAAIRSEWGHLPLSGHQDWVPTDCPGRWYARLDELSARADAILAAHQAGTTPPPAHLGTAPDGTDLLAVDRDWGPLSAARIRAVMGLPADSPWTAVVRALQYWLSWTLDAYEVAAATGGEADHIEVDGSDGPITYACLRWWWNHCRVPEGTRVPDRGLWDDDVCGALQIALNHSTQGTRALACRG